MGHASPGLAALALGYTPPPLVNGPGRRRPNRNAAGSNRNKVPWLFNALHMT